MLKLEKQIDDFLEQTGMQQDYHIYMHAAMSRVTKSARDLKRHLSRLQEIEAKYNKDGVGRPDHKGDNK